MSHDEFKSIFGAPSPSSAVVPATLGLPASEALADFTADGCTGVFRGGLLSVCSVREADGGLYGWEAYLPAGCRLVATGAFGFLFASTGEDLWVIDTQNGQVVESDIPLIELLEVLTDEATREDFLKESLFEDWRELSGGALIDQVLSPTPAIALGGTWALVSMSPSLLPVYLSLTSGLFAGGGPNGVEVRRLE